MRDFRNYIWDGLRKGIFQLWILLVVLSAFSYSGVIFVIKSKDLSSGLKVAAYTVQEALKAGDWPLAIGHLAELERSGPVFDIRLRRKDGGTNVTGPFGQPVWGFGGICSDAPAGPDLMVSGCMHIYGPAETSTILLFLIFASILFFVVFRFFRSRMLFFIGKVSDEIKGMSTLKDSGEPKTEAGNISEINDVREFILGLLREREETAQALAASRLSRQVAHDIRSPLTALDSLLGDVSQIPEDKRVLLRSSIGRIRDIANNLLGKRDGNSTSAVPKLAKGVHLIASHVEAVVSEKRYQYREREYVDIDLVADISSYHAVSEINPNEFKRALSNLIDNAVEAVGKTGQVRVALASTDAQVHLAVSDTGKGIPKEILSKLGSPGATFGKTNGSGLGLYQAKGAVASWGGNLEISSTIGRGTHVEITLPKHLPPLWFVPMIEIPPGSKVIVLDDDETIHLTWKNRFDKLGSSSRTIDLKHFHSADSFTNWWKDNRLAAPSICLIDFELLGSTTNGLDLIESLDLEGQAILVTSHCEDLTLLSRCARKGIKLLPKGMANYVPIEIKTPEVEAVLIDDDEIVRMNWATEAQRTGHQFKSFRSPRAFFQSAKIYSTSTPVYIDSNLGDGVKGEVIAKDIFEMGFRDITLTTGFSKDEFGHMPWIKDIVGKEAPWAKRQGEVR